MDYDHDGITDLISTTYSEGAWFFKGLGEGQFQDKVKITLADGKGFGMRELRYIALSAILEDWNNDGKVDLVTNNIFNNNGLAVFENIGSSKEPIYKTESEYFKTIPGKGINGFSIVYHDLNNDGLKDFVISDDYNGIVWYQNVGSKSQPKFADKKYLLGRALTDKEKDAKVSLTKGIEFNEEADKSTVPAWGKIHFSFADINGDGKDDLLVGDAYEKVSKAKELTREEKIQYEKLMKDYIETDKIIRPILKKRRKILNEASSSGVRVVMPKELELDKKVSEKNRIASNEIRKMHSQMSKIEKFGRVWVYIRE